MKRKTIVLPEKGINYDELERELDQIKTKDVDVEGGKVFAYAFHYNDEHMELIKRAYSKFFSANGLNPMAFPSAKKFEAEVVSMMAGLLGGDFRACGNMTTGGTESLLMAVKSYRDYYKLKKPEIRQPEMIIPVSAHPAFYKAAHYFGITLIECPLMDDYRVNVEAVKKAITKNTILIAGSATDFSRGVVDPIPELAALAKANDIGFHTDGCIGSLVLEFMKKNGEQVPEFDLSVDGVTSISCDLHKYGNAAKGASVLIFNNEKIWKNQFYVYPNSPTGIYASPTMLGTRSGGIMAAAWTSIRAIGVDGFKDITKTIYDAVKRYQTGINAIPELKVLGKPAGCIFSFTSDVVNPYALADTMFQRGWVLDRLQKPQSLHMTVTWRTAKNVDPFLKDLKECVAYVKANPQKANEGDAAMYGMIATFDSREKDKLDGILRSFLADQYKTR